MGYRKIQVEDADLNRVQQAVADAFAELNGASDHNVNVVTPTKAYTCTGQEDYIVLTTGAITVTLRPARQQQRKVTLVPNGGTAAAVTADGSFKADVNTASVGLISTGKAWVKL